MRTWMKVAGATLTVALLAGVVPDSSAQTIMDTPNHRYASVRTITLVTGDRVTISGPGALRVDPGPGRDGVVFLSQRRRAVHLP